MPLVILRIVGILQIGAGIGLVAPTFLRILPEATAISAGFLGLVVVASTLLIHFERVNPLTTTELILSAAAVVILVLVGLARWKLMPFDERF